MLAFTSILFISSLFYTAIVLDYTLAPRFFILSALLLLYIVACVPTKAFANPISLIPATSITLFLWSIASSIWATNSSEVWFVSSKLACSASVFLISIHHFRTNPNSVNAISITAVSIAFFAVVLSFIQFREIELFGIRFDHESPIYYITSISSHKNLVSSFLYLLLPFIIIGKYRSMSLISIVKYFIIACIVVVLIVLKTRAVFIALAGVVAVFSGFLFFITTKHYSRKLKSRLLYVLGFSILFALVIITPILLAKFSGNAIGNTDSFQERVLIWRNTLKMIADNPILGVGAGNWQIHFPQYSLEGIWRCDELNVTFQRPHNDFLWVWSELGIIGFVLQMTVWVGALFYGLRAYRMLTYRPDQIRLVLFISFYIGGSVILFFDFPIERAEHTIWMALGAAYLFSQSNSTHQWRNPYPQLARLFAICILAFSMYVSFKRVSGEYFTKKVYVAKQHRDGRSMIRNATQAMSFAYSLDPVSVPILWYCGNAYVYEKNMDAALGCFKHAFFAHPYQRNVLNDLGTGYLIKNNIPLAEKYYKEAHRISPRYDEPILNLINLYIQVDKLEEARKWDLRLTHDSPRRDELKALIYE